MGTALEEQPKTRKSGSGRRKSTRPIARKRQVYHELAAIASAQGMRVTANQVSTAEVLQEVLDRATAHLRFAASKVDELDPEPEPILSGDVAKMRELAGEYGVEFGEDDTGNEIRRKIRASRPEPMWERRYDAEGAYLGEEPSKWYRLEAAARAEVTNLAGMMEKLGLAERMVRVEEARTALVVRAVAEAAREAGVPRDQIRAMGSIIRDKLEEGAQ